jgi:hypothetical protein
MPTRTDAWWDSKHRAHSHLRKLDWAGEINRARLIKPASWRGVVDWPLAGGERTTKFVPSSTISTRSAVPTGCACGSQLAPDCLPAKLWSAHKACFFKNITVPAVFGLTNAVISARGSDAGSSEWHSAILHLRRRQPDVNSGFRAGCRTMRACNRQEASLRTNSTTEQRVACRVRNPRETAVSAARR